MVHEIRVLVLFCLVFDCLWSTFSVYVRSRASTIVILNHIKRSRLCRACARPFTGVNVVCNRRSKCILKNKYLMRNLRCVICLLVIRYLNTRSSTSFLENQLRIIRGIEEIRSITCTPRRLKLSHSSGGLILCITYIREWQLLMLSRDSRALCYVRWHEKHRFFIFSIPRIPPMVRNWFSKKTVGLIISLFNDSFILLSIDDVHLC